MKRKTLNRILSFLVIATLFVTACTKEKSDVRLPQKLATTQVLNIKSDSALVVGYVLAEGDGFTERGICYNTAAAPTIANNKIVYTGQLTTAAFKIKVGGLKYATKYYARAYATGANGTVYGDEYSFTTLSVAPFLTTTVATAITGTTATSGGNVTDNGGEAVTARGVCWGTAHNPTISDSKSSDGTGSGVFPSNLTNLLGKTTYYARAYATNKIGTGYGPEISFMTLVAVPTLTTTEITNVTADGASSGGNITISGGDVILERGVCWSTTANPTVADSKTSNGTGTGIFTSALTGLSVATTYHVRAYAKNSAGYGYGPDIFFMTFPTALYALGDATAAQWDNSIAVKIDQSATPGIYVANLSLTGGKNLKFISTLGQWQPQWGLGSADGKLAANLGGGSDPGTITTPAGDGLYKVTVDLSAMTYKVESAYPSALYMIGDGVGGWSWDTVDLPMVPVNGQPNLFWKIVWMEATGGFKFAPQKAWSGDFGQPVKDLAVPSALYDKGGENIPVMGTAGYYMVVVNLATSKISVRFPQVYLMGNTIGSWDTANAAGLFTVDNANTLINVTKTLSADDLRIYAWHPWFTDWWRSEFIILSGKIAFRGNGNDQTRVAVTAGSHTVNLNFKTGNATIQ
jgi:hypothetical protein